MAAKAICRCCNSMASLEKHPRGVWLCCGLRRVNAIEAREPIGSRFCARSVGQGQILAHELIAQISAIDYDSRECSPVWIVPLPADVDGLSARGRRCELSSGMRPHARVHSEPHKFRGRRFPRRRMRSLATATVSPSIT
jgi:hypothetical protein